MLEMVRVQVRKNNMAESVVRQKGSNCHALCRFLLKRAAPERRAARTINSRPAPNRGSITYSLFFEV